VLAGLTDLEHLRISFEDPSGTLTDTQDLRTHHGLHSLQLDDAYGWDPGSLPELPSLTYLEINGTRKGTAAAVKARFKGTGVDTTVRGAKSDAWLAAHMTNPFRDWVEDSKPFGTAACKAYARALLALEAIAPEAPGRMVTVERVLRGFIADLNALDAKYQLIDTMNRETACEVFIALAERAGVPTDQAELWLSDRRF
jgi:hypothetical protein